MAYCIEEVERQQFLEVSDLQAVADRSTAAVLASLGWQDFYRNVNVPAFFNTIGRLLSLAGSAPKQTWDALVNSGAYYNLRRIYFRSAIVFFTIAMSYSGKRLVSESSRYFLAVGLKSSKLAPKIPNMSTYRLARSTSSN